MRTESEIIARLEQKKAYQKYALENRMFWGISDLRHEVEELEWVLGDDEK